MKSLQQKFFFFNSFEVYRILEIFRSSHYGAESLFYQAVLMESHEQFRRLNLYNWICSSVKRKLEELVFSMTFNYSLLELFRSSHFDAKSLFQQSVCMVTHRQFQRRNLYNWICFTVKLKLNSLHQNFFFVSGFEIFVKLEIFKSSHFGVQRQQSVVPKVRRQPLQCF